VIDDNSAPDAAPEITALFSANIAVKAAVVVDTGDPCGFVGDYRRHERSGPSRPPLLLGCR
jgi:hypothetical protein